jgi:hypothetical protein
MIIEIRTTDEIRHNTDIIGNLKWVTLDDITNYLSNIYKNGFCEERICDLINYFRDIN